LLGFAAYAVRAVLCRETNCLVTRRLVQFVKEYFVTVGVFLPCRSVILNNIATSVSQRDSPNQQNLLRTVEIKRELLSNDS